MKRFSLVASISILAGLSIWQSIALQEARSLAGDALNAASSARLKADALEIWRFRIERDMERLSGELSAHGMDWKASP